MFDLSWREIATALAAGWVVGMSWFLRRLQSEIEKKVARDEYMQELALGRQSRASIHEKLDDIKERVSHIEGRMGRHH